MAYLQIITLTFIIFVILSRLARKVYTCINADTYIRKIGIDRILVDLSSEKSTPICSITKGISSFIYTGFKYVINWIVNLSLFNLFKLLAILVILFLFPNNIDTFPPPIMEFVRFLAIYVIYLLGIDYLNFFLKVPNHYGGATVITLVSEFILGAQALIFLLNVEMQFLVSILEDSSAGFRYVVVVTLLLILWIDCFFKRILTKVKDNFKFHISALFFISCEMVILINFGLYNSISGNILETLNNLNLVNYLSALAYYGGKNIYSFPEWSLGENFSPLYQYIFGLVFHAVIFGFFIGHVFTGNAQECKIGCQLQDQLVLKKRTIPLVVNNK